MTDIKTERVVTPNIPDAAEMEQPSAQVASVSELNALMDEHNSIVKDITNLEQTELLELKQEERDVIFADLDAKYARVQELRPMIAQKQERQNVDLTPIHRASVDQMATPAIMTRQGEQNARSLEVLMANPMDFWGQTVLAEYNDMVNFGTESGGGFNITPQSVKFRLPGSGRAYLGPAQRLPGFEDEYKRLEEKGIISAEFDSVEFATPIATPDAQEPTRGYLGRYGPIYSPYRAIGITPQVMAPGWRFDYLDGTISTNRVGPSTEGTDIAETEFDWGDTLVTLATVSARTRIRRSAVRSNSAITGIIGRLLEDLTTRDISDDISQGDGTGTPARLRGLATAGRGISNNNVIGATTPGVNYIRGIYAAADGVEYAGGGMVTHALIRHEALEAIRTERDNGGWLDRYPGDRGEISVRGARLVGTNELPDYAATSRIAIVGDWTGGIMLARLGDMEVVIDESQFASQNMTQVIVNADVQVVVPINEKFEYVTRTS